MSRPAGAFLLNKFTIDLFLKVVGHSIINLTTIGIYLSNPLKTTDFSRLHACFLFKPYLFALVFALTSQNKGNFYSPPTTLSSSLAEVRFASLVE